MKKPLIKIKHKIPATILLIVSIVLLVVFIYSLGKEYLPFFSSSVDFKEPTYISYDKDNNLTALTDNQFQRISTFNNKHEVDSVSSFSSFKNTADVYCNIAKMDDICYVVHLQYDEDSGYIAKEEILAQKGNQSIQTVVYEQNYSIFTDHIKTPRITDLRAEEDTLFFTKKSTQNSKELQTLKIENCNAISNNDENTIIQPCVIQSAILPFSEESVFEAKYNPHCNKTVFTSFFGAVYQISEINKLECIYKTSPEKSFYCACVDDNGNIYATDDITYHVHKINNNSSELIDIDVDANYIDIFNNNLVVSDSLSNSVIMYNTSNMQVINSINSVPYCASLLMYSILISLSILYFFVLLIFITVKAVIHLKNKSQLHTKKIVAFIVAALIIIIGICVSFVYINYTQVKNTQKQSLETFCYQVSQTNSTYFQKANDPTLSNNEKDVLYKTFMGNLETYYYSYALGEGTYIEFNIFPNKKLETYFDLYNIDKDSIEFTNVEDLNYLNLLITSEVNNNDVIVDGVHYRQDGKIEVFSGEFLNGKGIQIYAGTPIYNQFGNLSGFICVTSPIFQIIVRQVQAGSELFLGFLIIACAVSLISIELLAHVRCIKTARKIKKYKTKCKTQFCGARMLYFVAVFIEYSDLSYRVLIAQDILNSQYGEYSESLLGIPLSIAFIGGMIGTIIAKFLMPRLPARKIQITCSFLLIIVIFATIVSIIYSIFEFYCLCKFLSGVLIYVLTFMAESIQNQTNNSKLQKNIVNEIALATVSAGAFGGLAGGYLSQYFGYNAIYFLCIFAAVVNIFVILYFVPKNEYFIKSLSKHSKKTNKLKYAHKQKTLNLSGFKILLKPQLLCVFVFLIFVSILAYQYSSVIFPLMAQENGMNKAQMGNIILIITCLVFVVNTVAKKYLLRTSQRLIAVFVLLLMGFTLLCFIINSSIIWIIFSLFPILIGYRLSSTSYKLVWVPFAKKMHIEKSTITFYVMQARELSKFITPILVASFLSFGNVVACVIIGLICCLSAVLFWLMSKH